jgi:hypothetical protein
MTDASLCFRSGEDPHGFRTSRVPTGAAPRRCLALVGVVEQKECTGVAVFNGSFFDHASQQCLVPSSISRGNECHVYEDRGAQSCMTDD